MALPPTPLPISKESQAAVVVYLQSAQNLFGTSYNIRAQLLQRDRAYYREADLTEEQLRAKFANRTGDSKKIQNVTVPVVMPHVETQVAYLTNVFLTGFPIFGAVAGPEDQAALAGFDAVISDNSIVGAWPMELMKTLRNGEKYDLGAVEVVWENRKIYNIETPQLKDITKGDSVEELYSGNFMKDIDPYNLILDTRVSPDKNHLEGEYAGYTEALGRIAMKKRMEDLPKEFTMNYKDAFECGSAAISTTASDAGYYIPTINPDALLPVANRSEHDWMAWASLSKTKENRIAYHNSYEWTVLYCRIIPEDFGMRVPNPTKVQIWKFIIINRQVVIYAERQTNAHNYLPIIVCKPSNDGMGWQSKSRAENVTPMQEISSALMNSAIASQRRKVYDRILYDPTRVRKSDIDNTDPVARIPVKNSQFGKGFEGAVQSMQYSDTGVAEIIQMSQQVTQMADVANGQNRVMQGQFQKGNKTRREFDTTMGNAGARQQMESLALEYSFFMPIKTIIKANILQYQMPTKKVDPKTGASIDVNPTDLRKAMMRFSLSDGMLNSEKMASLDVAGTVLQAAATVPQIQQEYDIMGILSYVWDMQGLHWLPQFKRSPEQMQAQLAQVAATTAAQGNAKPPQQQPPDAGAAGAI